MYVQFNIRLVFANLSQGERMIYSCRTRKHLFQTRTLLRLNSVHLSAETFLIIICGCLPTLRPLYLQLFKRPGNSASGGPSHPLPGLPFSRKLKNSDASDSSNNEQYTRIVESNKPSINASLINVGHPIDINTWIESE